MIFSIFLFNRPYLIPLALRLNYTMSLEFTCVCVSYNIAICMNKLISLRNCIKLHQFMGSLWSGKRSNDDADPQCDQK